MHRSERINDMIQYLNDKNSFQLKDIMNRYSVSKSTALRDIRALEEIGMPIYSQAGRNGHYGILANRLLSPIIFTVDEMYALYFAMLTLNSYETTPFHLSLEKLKQKFEMCLSAPKIEMVHKMEQILSLGVTKHHNSSKFLKDILQMAIEEKVCEIQYRKGNEKRKYLVQFFHISAAYGQWYTTAYNFKSNKTQVFRCDKILEVEKTAVYQASSLKELIKPVSEMFKDKDSTEFEIQISEKGADLFYKEHYPSMQLSLEVGQYFIKGFYNKGEENFIANYLICYAENIISIKPEKLKNLIIDKLNSLKQYFGTV